MYTYVVFHDQESLRRVPKEGQSFHIPAPVIEDKPGGLGLDDIRHLLDSTGRDESFKLPSAASTKLEESKERMIGARIERAGMLSVTFLLTNVKIIAFHRQKFLHITQVRQVK